MFSIKGAFENSRTHVRLNQAVLRSTDLLCYGASASHEMQDEQYEPHNEDDVNESTGNVECEKSQQPKNNENRGD
jgi:hypothetical protein